MSSTLNATIDQSDLCRLLLKSVLFFFLFFIRKNRESGGKHRSQILRMIFKELVNHRLIVMLVEITN